MLPFLVLGLGVDDMFVIADEFFELESKAEPHTPIRILISKTLRKVGPSITLTSITNSSGFFLAAIIPIPAMRVFALQVSVILAITYQCCIILLGWNCNSFQLFWSSFWPSKLFGD